MKIISLNFYSEHNQNSMTYEKTILLHWSRRHKNTKYEMINEETSMLRKLHNARLFQLYLAGQ